MDRVKRIFITGVTGVLGRQILELFLFQRNIEIVLLIRGKSQSICNERYGKILKEILNGREVLAKVRIISGDITKSYLGVNKKDYDQLCDSINEIFHCAARVDYYQFFKKGQSVNVIGTKNILKFSKRCATLNRLNYISTIFIAGNIKGEFKEDNLDVNQSFNGPYEKSKFDSEILVRKAFNKEFDISIYRPSAIVGEYTHGKVANFQMFYQFFRSLSLNLFKILPINFRGVFNFVPCDFAAKAIFLLSQNNRRNAVYHIISPENLSILELIKFAVKYLNCEQPLYVDIQKYNLNNISIYERKLLEIYMPFLNFRTIFNGQKTIKELKKMGFTYPALNNQFIVRLFNYAIDNRFIIKNKGSNA